MIFHIPYTNGLWIHLEEDKSDISILLCAGHFKPNPAVTIIPKSIIEKTNQSRRGIHSCHSLISPAPRLVIDPFLRILPQSNWSLAHPSIYHFSTLIYLRFQIFSFLFLGIYGHLCWSVFWILSLLGWFVVSLS